MKGTFLRVKKEKRNKQERTGKRLDMLLLDEIIYPTFGWVGREGLSGEVAI